MQDVKHKIIAFWLTHFFLRRIAKRYPEYFERWVKDVTDNITARKIMALRYVGDNPKKFEAISLELNIAPRRVFEYHKKVVDRIIGGI